MRLILPCARFNLLTPLAANHHLDGDLFFKMLLHNKAGKSVSSSSCCMFASGACLGAVVALTTFCALFYVALQSSSVRWSVLVLLLSLVRMIAYVFHVFRPCYLRYRGALPSPQWLCLSGFRLCYLGQWAPYRMNLGFLPRAGRLRRLWMVLFAVCSSQRCVSCLLPSLVLRRCRQPWYFS